MLSLDRTMTNTSISLNIDDVDEEEGATGGTPLPDANDDGRPPTADDQPASPKNVRPNSRPTTAVTAAPASPDITEPQDDPAPANDDEDNPQESIDSILKKKIQRKLK